MRVSRKLLELKVKAVNKVSPVQIRLDDSVANGYNLYTVQGTRVCTGSASTIDSVLDALSVVLHEIGGIA